MGDDGDVEYPRLPRGWSDDPTSLTLSQLDDYGIKRKAGSRVLSLEDRQLEYFRKYIADEPESGANGVEPAAALKYIAIGIVALVAFFGLIALLGIGEAGPDEDMAMAACERRVEANLKAPATAKFPVWSTARIRQSGDTFAISSHVDSENGFGATLRTSWSCTATWIDGDRYDVSVSFD